MTATGKFTLLGVIGIVAAVLSYVLLQLQRGTPSATIEGKNETAMQLTSSAFPAHQPIPVPHTCDGANVSPPLSLAGVPEDAQSIALIVDDPDAPRGDWVHWTVWNISPDTRDTPENTVPAGATEGLTDFGKPGYGGPCPPSGTHRYQFKAYALDTMLDLPSSARKADLERAMAGHILAQTVLVGTYRRQH